MLGSTGFIRTVVGGNNAMGFVLRNARFFASASTKEVGGGLFDDNALNTHCVCC
jgi:hypothetical protein